MPKKKPRGGRREGAGRPRVIEDATETRSLMSASMLEALDAMAAIRGQTRSEAIREAVGEWVQRCTGEIAEGR